MTPTLTVTRNTIPQALTVIKVSLRQTWPQVLRGNMRLVAVSASFQTQPFGNGDEARKMGQNAVRRDIHKVYASPVDIFEELKVQDMDLAKAFYAALDAPDRIIRNGKGQFVAKVSGGNLAEAQAILQRSSGTNRNTPVGDFDGGTFHRASRNSRGRVSRRRAAQVTANYDEAKKYLVKIQARVGFAKAGWAMCAKALGGTRGIAGWISRQRSAGRVIDRSNQPNNPSVIIINDVTYVDRCLSQSQLQEALRVAVEKTLKRAEIILAAEARKAGFHTR